MSASTFKAEHPHVSSLIDPPFFKIFSPPMFISIVSTGYGNIAPSTEGGKIFCILYAIFGIPLFGFLLAGIGDQLGTIFVKSILRVEKIFRVSCKVTKCSVIS